MPGYTGQAWDARLPSAQHSSISFLRKGKKKTFPASTPLGGNFPATAQVLLLTLLGSSLEIHDIPLENLVLHTGTAPPSSQELMVSGASPQRSPCAPELPPRAVLTSEGRERGTGKPHMGLEPAQAAISDALINHYNEDSKL